MAFIRNVPTECLLNNIIDEEFQAAMFPLNIFQLFFLTAKFNVINNFITPKNNFSYYISSVIGAVGLVFAFLFRFFYYYSAVETITSSVVTFFMYFDLVFYSIVSVVVHIVNACHSGNTVELIIKLHTVLNSIKIHKRPFLYKVKIQNWISIVILAGVYMFFFFVPDTVSYTGPAFVLVKIMLVLPSLVFDLQIVIVTRLVVLIKNELVAWNNIIEKYKKGINKTVGELNNEEPTENDMFGAYVNIVRSFQLCNKVYKFSFTLIGLETFIHILADLQMVLEFGKSAGQAGFFQSTLMRWLTGAWNLKNFCLLTLLSIACENFYETVRNAEASCAQVLCNNDVRYTGMRRTCKNVLRVSRASLRKLSACGVFELDATLPLRLLSALLSYTVVLLQFEFL